MTQPASDLTPLVFIPVFGRFDLAIACIRAVVQHTPESVEILVVDDGSPTPLASQLPEGMAGDPRIRWVRNETNIGYLRSANCAMSLRLGADVALVNSDVLVGPEWFARLRAAAYSATNVATASAMTDEGAILTVSLDGMRVRAGDADAIRRVNENLAALLPMAPAQIPVAVGHCIYVRGDAIVSVGVFDEAYGMGYEEEVDFSLRCANAGLIQVVAPDVYVHHEGSASFGARASPLRESGHQLLLSRYPHYEKTVQSFLLNSDGLSAVFLRALLADREHVRLLVIVGDFPDARPTEGVTELLTKLRENRVTVTLLIPDKARGHAHGNGDEIERLTLGELTERVIRHGRYDCVLAIGAPKDRSRLSALWSWGHRVIVVQGNFTEFALPGHHGSGAAWVAYRDAVASAVLTADAFVGATSESLLQALALGVPIDPVHFSLTGEDAGASSGRSSSATPEWSDLASPLARRIWDVCSLPPRIPAAARNRIHAVRLLRSEKLRRLRHSSLGRRLVPPGSSRAMAAKALSRFALR